MEGGGWGWGEGAEPRAGQWYQLQRVSSASLQLCKSAAWGHSRAARFMQLRCLEGPCGRPTLRFGWSGDAQEGPWVAGSSSRQPVQRAKSNGVNAGVISGGGQ